MPLYCGDLKSRRMKIIMASVTFTLIAVAAIVTVSVLGLREQSTSGKHTKLQDFITVATKYGKVRGLNSSIDGVSISTFYGIPFAKRPIGNLRFSPPIDPEPWFNVKDALIPGSKCVQIEHGESKASGSEDCLFINVHTPTKSIATAEGIPVMVWVHGGSYRSGQGAIYNGKRLATKGVVVVTFNYRLDALGFLSTEDDVIPGNYGMLDQLFALRWVNMNIAAFGGDPQKVTLFGESAGSSSVSLLVLSPLTKGLFRSAIMESGMSLNPWSYAHPARSVSHKQAATLVAGNIGCSSSETKQLLQCLKSASAAHLVEASKYVCDATFGSGILMNPRVEKVNGFLPDLPLRLLKNGNFNKVSTIRGFNEDEGGFFIDLKSLDKTATAETFVEGVKNTFKKVNISDATNITNEIAKYYLKGIPNTPLAYAQAIEQFQTDLEFLEPNAIELPLFYNASKNGTSHFQYKFRVRPELTTQPEWVTAVHTDEIRYVFGFGREFSKPRHRAVMDTMMAMWTNFAKTGDPRKNETNNENSGNELINRGTKITDQIHIDWEPFDLVNRNMLVFNINGTTSESFDEKEKASAFLCLLLKINKMDDSSCTLY